jgi:hypothetical protein
MKASRKSRSPRTVESLIRKTRHTDVTSAGVRKSLSPAHTSCHLFGVVVDGRVLMNGSPSMMLPELLHEAESGLDSPTSPRSAESTFRTPSPAPSSFRRPEAPLIIDTEGPRELSRKWTQSAQCHVTLLIIFLPPSFSHPPCTASCLTTKLPSILTTYASQTQTFSPSLPHSFNFTFFSISRLALSNKIYRHNAATMRQPYVLSFISF